MLCDSLSGFHLFRFGPPALPCPVRRRRMNRAERRQSRMNFSGDMLRIGVHKVFSRPFDVPLTKPAPVRVRASIIIEFTNHLIPEASPTSQTFAITSHTRNPYYGNDIRLLLLEKNMWLRGLFPLLSSVSSYMKRRPWFRS